MLEGFIPSRSLRNLAKKIEGSDLNPYFLGKGVQVIFEDTKEAIDMLRDSIKESIEEKKAEKERERRKRLFDIAVLGGSAPHFDIPRHGSFSLQNGEPINIRKVQENAANQLFEQFKIIGP